METNKSKANEPIESVGSIIAVCVVPAWLRALRDFNTHFLTLWHLTYLLSRGIKSNRRAAFSAMSMGGISWRLKLSEREFAKFDAEFGASLSFIKTELTSSAPTSSSNEDVEGKFDQGCLIVIANYDKCLKLAKVLGDKIYIDNLDVVNVCCGIINSCRASLADFKQNSPVWISQFLFRVHQLLRLAQIYYRSECDADHSSKQLDALSALDTLFLIHLESTTKLRQHFTQQSQSSSITQISSNALNSEMFLPTIPLATLISTLKENAKCQAEQIPTAVTSIMHEYCHLDPFCIDDAKYIQLNVTMSTTNK